MTTTNAAHWKTAKTTNTNFKYNVNLSGQSHGDRSAPRFIKWIEMHRLGTAVHHPYVASTATTEGDWTSMDIFTNDYASLKKILDCCNGFDYDSTRIEEIYPNG